MALRQAFTVRQGGIVIVNDWSAFLDAIDPNACLADRIMKSGSFGGTHGCKGVGRPDLQRKRGLIGIQEVIKTNLAASNRLTLGQSGLQQFGKRVRFCGSQKVQACGHDGFVLFASRNVGDGTEDACNCPFCIADGCFGNLEPPFTRFTGD